MGCVFIVCKGVAVINEKNEARGRSAPYTCICIAERLFKLSKSLLTDISSDTAAIRRYTKPCRFGAALPKPVPLWCGATRSPATLVQAPCGAVWSGVRNV